MADFPELKEALRNWVDEAIAKLAADREADYVTMDPPQWGCDPDGVFRDTARQVEGWNREKLDELRNLPSWPPVVEASQQDGRLSRQIDILVGTIQGTTRLQVFGTAQYVLPRPSEVGRAAEAFEEHYSKLESFLAPDELEFAAIWPIPGFASEQLPVQLDPQLELDGMSSTELAVALRLEMVRPTFPGVKLLDPEPEHRTCLRYRYSLPKIVDPPDNNANEFQELEDRLQRIRSAFQESLALVLPQPVSTAGRFIISSGKWNPVAGVAFQQATMPPSIRLRRVQMDTRQGSELVEVWRSISKPGLLQKQKGIALALRRLSYQGQRERPEDELLDVMIAAEALYLQELGNEPYRGELRYRLSLRAALWADTERLGFTKYEVLKLMQSAYDARSAIAHGGTQIPKG